LILNPCAVLEFSTCRQKRLYATIILTATVTLRTETLFIIFALRMRDHAQVKRETLRHVE